MGLEIERKFLVDISRWQQVSKGRGQLMRQGYLLTDPQKTIRVRLTEAAAYITIKGITTGATRAEYEYAIPREDAGELLDQFAIAELSKTRYEILHEGKCWEVDEFHKENEGLLIAEIELENEDEPVSLPAWVSREVTGDEKYYNSNLTLKPYKKWADH
jgi:CYTH domain-containing protein